MGESEVCPVGYDHHPDFQCMVCGWNRLAGVPKCKLPWVKTFERRCRAHTGYRKNQSWGRCELKAGHKGDHALDRGMDFPRWSTEWTG